MNSFLFLIVAAVVAVVLWGLIEPWRQQRRWQRHRERQNMRSTRKSDGTNPERRTYGE